LIKRIEFGGLRAYPAGRLLKLIKTKRRWWGSFLSGSGVLKDEQFQEDLEKLREYYRSNGYIDMEVKGTRVERTSPKWMVVHIDLFEGGQYKVGEVKIEGVKIFPLADVQKRLRMTTGQTFTPDGLSKDLKALEDFYGSRGYLDTGVRSTRLANVETGRLDLNYAIREGELAYIAKVEIRGNNKTKDKVVRRELAVAPGDVYNTVRADASRERLKNLGYFSKVEATPEPTPVPNRRDLVIQVEEQRTGNVTFGAGFSSIDNLIGFVEVTQGNFDLFNWPSFTFGGGRVSAREQLSQFGFHGNAHGWQFAIGKGAERIRAGRGRIQHPKHRDARIQHRLPRAAIAGRHAPAQRGRGHTGLRLARQRVPDHARQPD
jgi:outer membrane protein insertion porin family